MPLTFGQKAAGLDSSEPLKPEQEEKVNLIRGKYAEMIDLLNDQRTGSSGEKARYFSKAISGLEDSLKNAITAATWRH